MTTTTPIAAAEKKMEALIAGMTTEQIAEAVVTIGSKDVSNDRRFLRAVLLTVYEERVGEAVADALMTSIGL